jgi:hypothetical protein
MAVTIKHAKTDNIANWTQPDLDAQIALGNFPPGTLLADIVLPSDWNSDHNLTGTIPIANGGTGQTTATDAINALLPSQTSNTGKVLTTDGTNTSWSTNGNGTVTSVSGTGTVSGINLSGTITSSGSLTLGGTLDLSSPPAIGGTAPNTGAFTYISTNSSTSVTPTLSFNASNSPYAAGATIAGSYLQHLIQNKSGTASASTNYVLSNDLGTDSTYYGEFGMNSSIYSSGTPADFFSLNNGIYFSGHDGDISVGSGNGYKLYLTWGTAGQSAHVINATGAIGLNTNITGTTNFGTAGQVLTSQGSASTPTWTSVTASAGGSNTQVQYNSSGSLAGSANFTFNGTTVTTANDASISGLTVGKGGGAISSNTVVGLNSFVNNTTGNNSVAIGNFALRFNTTGYYNTAVGVYSLYYNTSGIQNTAYGYNSLANNTTANNNTGIGFGALQNSTTNVATLGSITGGSGYTTGTYTGVVMTLSSGSTATTYPTATIVVAGGAVTTVTITSAGVGFKDTTTVLTAPAASIGGTGSGFTVPVATLATGANNTAVGYQALNANTTAVSNTAVGYQSLLSNTTGNYNTAVGGGDSGAFSPLKGNTTAIQNTAIGNGALGKNTTGNSNTAVGYQVLLNNLTGQGNVGVGGVTSGSINAALNTNTAGSNNTAIGSGALTLTTVSDNTALGWNSGAAVSTGSQNTLIGRSAGNTLTTGSNNTVIGYNAAVSAVGVSNEVTIGNSSVTATRLQGNLGVSGTQPAAWATPNASAIDMNFAALSFDSTSGGVYLSSNLYESSTSPTTWNVKTNASPNSSYYAQVSGLHSWVYAAPAAIGTAVTLVSQMSLSTAGVLNVGSTSTAAINLNTIQASGGSGSLNFCLVSSGTATGSITALREGGSFATSLIFSTAVGGGTVTEALRINSSQNVGIGLSPNANTKLDVNGPIRAKGYTVATLPTGVVGARAYVTDALAPTFLGTLTGGGAVTAPAFYNGTAWVAG